MVDKTFALLVLALAVIGAYFLMGPKLVASIWGANPDAYLSLPDNAKAGDKIIYVVEVKSYYEHDIVFDIRDSNTAELLATGLVRRGEKINGTLSKVMPNDNYNVDVVIKTLSGATIANVNRVIIWLSAVTTEPTPAWIPPPTIITPSPSSLIQCPSGYQPDATKTSCVAIAATTSPSTTTPVANASTSATGQPIPLTTIVVVLLLGAGILLLFK